MLEIAGAYGGMLIAFSAIALLTAAQPREAPGAFCEPGVPWLMAGSGTSISAAAKKTALFMVSFLLHFRLF
jgi:hypothetical protein